MELTASSGTTHQSQSISVEALEEQMRMVLSKYTTGLEKHLSSETFEDSNEKSLMSVDSFKEIDIEEVDNTIIRLQKKFGVTDQSVDECFQPRELSEQESSPVDNARIQKLEQQLHDSRKIIAIKNKQYNRIDKDAKEIVRDYENLKKKMVAYEERHCVVELEERVKVLQKNLQLKINEVKSLESGMQDLQRLTDKDRNELTSVQKRLQDKESQVSSLVAAMQKQNKDSVQLFLKQTTFLNDRKTALGNMVIERESRIKELEEASEKHEAELFNLMKRLATETELHKKGLQKQQQDSSELILRQTTFLNDQKLALESVIEKQEVELTKLRKNSAIVSDRDARIKELEDILGQQKVELGNLQKVDAQKDDKFADVEKISEQRKIDIEKLQKQISEQAEPNKDDQQKVETLVKTSEQQKVALANLQKRLNEAVESKKTLMMQKDLKIANLNKTFQSQSEELETIRDEFQKIIDEKENKVVSLENALEEQKQDSAHLVLRHTTLFNNQKMSLETTIEKQNQDLSKLRKSLEEKLDCQDVTVKENDRVKELQKFSEQKIELAELQDLLVKEKGSREDAEVLSERHKVEIENLQKQLEEKADPQKDLKIETLVKTSEQQKVALANLQKRLNQEVESKKTLMMQKDLKIANLNKTSQSQSEKLETIRDEFQKIIDEKENKVVSLENTLEQQKQDSAHLVLRHTTLFNNQKMSLETTIEKQNQDLFKLRKSLEEKSDCHKELTNTLDERDSKIRHLQGNQTLIQEQIDSSKDLSKKLALLDTENVQLKADKKALQEQLKKLSFHRMSYSGDSGICLPSRPRESSGEMLMNGPSLDVLPNDHSSGKDMTEGSCLGCVEIVSANTDSRVTLNSTIIENHKSGPTNQAKREVEVNNGIGRKIPPPVAARHGASAKKHYKADESKEHRPAVKESEIIE
ncbi:interaptin-like [Clytia hemisphaerica]|uniref:interaptin-like n=1 Tax=Clytia hemisphaerica TaxID=252671 RepID=UPI0034D3AE01